jgi:CRISPR-associated protein (TIGR03986 family)
VPLPILGQPKPSAWEFYLRQDSNSKPVTYGDLPGDAGGELAGRKYYRHQPKVQQLGDIMGTPEAERSDQSTYARCICAVGTKFKFAVRFARLRKWELGALMAVLTPEFLGETGKTYAHKLGLGRPLGMGSVRIAIDAMRVRRERDAALATEDNRIEFEVGAIGALKEKLSGSDCMQWLKLHQYGPSGNISYPMESAMRRQPPPPPQTIYDWHTNRRREYSELRREKDPDWKYLSEKIQIAKGEE